MGESNYGYMQIPDEFLDFIDGNVAGVEMLNYGKVDQSFITTNMAYDASGKTFEDFVDQMKNTLTNFGGETKHSKEITIDGKNAVEFYQVFEEQDYHLYAYLIDCGDTVKYIALSLREIKLS